jgi:hypothetical protein
VQRDRELVAGFLRVEEADMLAELLGSAGIEAWVEGAIPSALGPVLPGAGGGAKLMVRRADAEQAREIIAASGVFRGEHGPVAEIPEQEWSAVPPAGSPGGRELETGTGVRTFVFYPLVVAAAVVAATFLRMLASR